MSETEQLTGPQVERLARVLPVLARGQKRHPDTSAAMTALGRLLRMCGRCGKTAVLGGPDDLTLCDRCASQVGYDCATADIMLAFAPGVVAECEDPNRISKAYLRTLRRMDPSPAVVAVIDRLEAEMNGVTEERRDPRRCQRRQCRGRVPRSWVAHWFGWGRR